MKRALRAIGLALWFSAASCLDTGQDRATVPLRLAGTAATEPAPGASGWNIELTRAELAFGPLYLCSGAQAGALCETARMEWLESAVVDALDGEARDAGVLRGVTGPVRSWMYDLGITSLLTRERPLVLSAAEQLGGSSLAIAGVAHKPPTTLPFLFEVAIQQEEATETGASVVRKSGSDRFAHDVTGNEAALTVRFDARPWIREVDFDLLVENSTCSADGPTVVCTEVPSTPGSQSYRAIHNALVAGERPAFEWSPAE